MLLTSIIFTLLFVFTTPVFGEEEGSNDSNDSPDLAPDAKSAILMERDTGEVIFDKNVDEKLPPASMTKIMTLLLIMEALEEEKLKLDETVRVSERAASMGGSQIFLEAGEEMTVEELLKGVAIASGNDASVALAERIAGSEEAFVEQMNEKVKELKLENTHFQNSTGLPADNHYSTAYDMAVMAKELLKYETITEYTSIYEDYLREGEEDEFWLVNTNKLVRFYDGVDGLKTGYTDEAKYCLTATAEKDDMRVISVVMGAETTKQRNGNISNMLDYAFNHFDTKKLFEKGETITELQFLQAEQQKINVVTSESVSTIHSKGESPEDISTNVQIDEEIVFPMKKGDQIGTLQVKMGDKVVTDTPLIVSHDVDEASFLTYLKRTLGEMAKHR